MTRRYAKETRKIACGGEGTVGGVGNSATEGSGRVGGEEGFSWEPIFGGSGQGKYCWVFGKV